MDAAVLSRAQTAPHQQNPDPARSWLEQPGGAARDRDRLQLDPAWGWFVILHFSRRYGRRRQRGHSCITVITLYWISCMPRTRRDIARARGVRERRTPGAYWKRICIKAGAVFYCIIGRIIVVCMKLLLAISYTSNYRTQPELDLPARSKIRLTGRKRHALACRVPSNAATAVVGTSCCPFSLMGRLT